MELKEKLIIISIICILGLFLILVLTPKGPEAKTELFFNAKSELPDSKLYINELNGKKIKKPIHVIDIGESYDVCFTIGWTGKTQRKYVYRVESSVLNLEDIITLEPGGVKNICVEITPEESQKWKLDFWEIEEQQDIIDLTENSWLAEKRSFDILLRENGLPAIVEENYNLPISTNVSGFGAVLHANISLEELRERPFKKKYVEETGSLFEKTENIHLINLSVNENQLYLDARSTTQVYVTEPQLFSITLFTLPLEKVKIVDDLLIKIKIIQFRYLVR